MTRYAAYIRISHEEQIGNYSLDAQMRTIESYIRQHQGRLVEVYVDEAETAKTTANRNDFLRMRQDAKKKKFDVLIVHKFDRLNRNRFDAIAIKSLLRSDLGIKVVSATEPSEHDGAVGALIEGILECIAEWYSRNLSEEYRKGKRERALQGLHNSLAPFGTKLNSESVLVRDEDNYAGLVLAYELYSTGNYSDLKVAIELNERGYRTTQGHLFSSDTVRVMLQNRTYTGYVRYSPYIIKSDGKRSKNEPVEWVKGRHEAFISVELFELCQEIRRNRVKRRDYHPHHRTYLLSGIAYCWSCRQRGNEADIGKEYGKMRAQAQGGGYRDEPFLYYRCASYSFARSCKNNVRAEIVENQVIATLLSLKPPTDWKERIVQAVGQVIGNRQLEQRMAEIREIIDRMDFRWDNGFITDKDAYVEQRLQLQQELEALTPIPNDELEQAADILDNFSAHWQVTNGDRRAQCDLIQMVVERVYIEKGEVVALVLRPDYLLMLNLDTKSPMPLEVETEK